MNSMILEMHPRLRVVIAFVPTLVLVAVIVAAILIDAWGLWVTSLVVGAAWFAVWAPIQALNLSERALRWLLITGLVGVLAGAVAFAVYLAR
jgi:hypothetical protein